MQSISIILFAAAALNAQYTGFNLDNIDKSADPCTNFFQYACGTWVKNNPIPADRSRWSRFEELNERNQILLRDILQTSAAKQGGSPIDQQIGNYYGACMDENAIEQKGVSPLKPELDRIAAMKDKSDLAEIVARSHEVGLTSLFNFYGRADYKNSKLIIAWLDQGGLSLPDRDYYFRTDPKSVEIREKYVAHLGKMFGLLGTTPRKQQRLQRP